jgi:mono/diheme cytochrome c family protein
MFLQIRARIVREELAATMAMGGAVLAMALLMILVTGCGKQTSAHAESDGMKGSGTEMSAMHDSGAVSATATPAASRVERGKYLVTICGCNDCHTPLKIGPKGPEPDFSRMLSGHPEYVKVTSAPKTSKEWLMSVAMPGTAFAGPWGISFAMNLTPDSLTGIGTWTEDLLIKALRTGKHWGTSRPIMPPMPWPFISQMTDEDLKSVYAYLRTIPPVKNQVPAYQPPTGDLASAAAPKN